MNEKIDCLKGLIKTKIDRQTDRKIEIYMYKTDILCSVFIKNCVFPNSLQPLPRDLCVQSHLLAGHFLYDEE